MVHANIAAAQTTIPLTPERWTATDSLRFTTYLGQPSLYINRGVALATGVEFREGTIEYDMATPRGGNFMGAVFHATSPENSEVVFFRPGQSGTMEAVQYAPALNGVAAAWQIYHGDDANAAASLAFDTWLHVRIDVSGATARLYLDNDMTPALTIPRLAGVGGSSVGVWTDTTDAGHTSRTSAPRLGRPPRPRRSRRSRAARSPNGTCPRSSRRRSSHRVRSLISGRSSGTGYTPKPRGSC
jgi:hypothetical protein